MKVAIDLVTGRASPSEYSHKSAWLYMLANQYKHAGYGNVKVLHKDESWDDYDLILLSHGMEFRDSLNLFGGAKDEPALKMRRIIEYEGQLLSTDIPMPDYGELGKTRIKVCSDVWRDTDWDAISEKCKSIDYLHYPQGTNSLIIGDSHCFSIYSPGDMVIRRDGKTMYGALDEGLENLIIDNGIDERQLKTLTDLKVYFGNIDIRHHLMRQEFPIKSTIFMLDSLELQLQELQKTYNIDNISIVQPLPIHNDERKLPKTGYFKGEPFFGSWEERNELVNTATSHMCDICNNNGWNLIKHPVVFVNEENELSTEVCERPKSVHLARKFYTWDLVNDVPNPNLNPDDNLGF